jgi:hypothetical protein
MWFSEFASVKGAFIVVALLENSSVWQYVYFSRISSIEEIYTFPNVGLF